MTKEQYSPLSTPSVTTYDVVVVGAGPYGLATAAHLGHHKLNSAIFGKPVELWRDNMPKGMFLRSHWWANTISDPENRYTYERFLQETSRAKTYPVSVEEYIDYCLWFQRQAVPNVDETYVASIERNAQGFVLTLVDGRVIKSRTVVMAPGMKYYAYCPAEYAHLSPELVSHSVDFNDASRFAGKTIIMVGRGQSAIEYAALLNEAGAHVHVITRKRIRWLEPDHSEGRTLWEQLQAPLAKIAPGWKNLILERMPYLFYYFPQEKKDRYIRNNYKAAANDWLWDRINGKVVLHEGVQVTQLSEADGGVVMQLSDGTSINADHIMLCTGYQVDIRKLPMLHQSLLSQIAMDEGTPLLSSWFESSVPGLYFIGMTSLRGFGPYYRFAFGNPAAAQRVAQSVARKLRKPAPHDPQSDTQTSESPAEKKTYAEL
jgi:FAD-dependent urate hydroxylase